jgi:hypothetical protein
LGVSLDGNELKILPQRQEDCEDVKFSAAVWFPDILDDSLYFRTSETAGENLMVAWTILEFRKSDGKQYRKAVDHFSTLPYGSIPDHDIDFFKDLITRLEEKWLELCDRGEKHLTACVSQTLSNATQLRY